jgi:hypothetical protein
MAIISKARLTMVTETKLGYRSFSNTLNEAKNESRFSASTTVFLSHSHDDLEKDLVNKAIVFLRSVGVRVYIDSNDSSMPPFTNAETAKKIKQEIKNNKKFVLLATNNSISSKWCNWELGFGDAEKYINNISLFPISENTGVWNGSEYLRIYPRIEETSTGSEVYKVIYPSGTQISLLDWLKQ